MSVPGAHQLNAAFGVTTVTLAAGAEVNDAIPVTVQLANPNGTAKAGAQSWICEAVGELTAAFRLAVSGAGTASLSTTAKSELAFTLTTAGTATITCTDVAGASAAAVLLSFRRLDGLGIPKHVVVTFN